MAGELGKASLDLEANLGTFERNVHSAEHTADSLEHSLETLVAVAKLAEEALQRVEMRPGQGARSEVSAEAILAGVKGISEESRTAAREIDRVKLDSRNATETELAGDLIDHKLDDIRHAAERTRLALDAVKLRIAGLASSSVVKSLTPGGRPGFGPFGSGFGRIGVLGTLVGAGAITAPAAGPGAVGLLAGIPTLATAGAGALGTLALAFHGVFKAIGGDKKAFDALTPTAKQFVLTVRSLSGELSKFREIAARSVFPGLTAGLKAALSPGTLNAIAVAVVELGRALGQAGAQWGRYFGSPQFQRIFGPLMAAAAQSIRVLSDATLHLFDAFGVLGRAAIPLVSWLNEMIDRGAKFADSWISAADASGKLAGAMSEARTSLALVGRLAGSLVNVIFALGAALYPVAKVAVKDLTDGFNELAAVIHRNQATIRAISGTLIDGLKTAVEGAAKGLGLLRDGLKHVVGEKASIITAIIAIGTVIAFTLGPEAAVIIGAIAAIGLIRSHWQAIADFFKTLGREILNSFDYLWVQLERSALKAALAVVEPFSHLPSFLGGWARKAKDAMQAELDKLHTPNMDWSAAAAQAGVKTGDAWARAFNAAAQSEIGTITAAPQGSHGSFENHQPAAHALLPGDTTMKPKPAEPKPGTHEWYMKYLGYDPTVGTNVFGSNPPFTKNLGSSGGKAAVIPAAVAHLEDLARQEASKASALHDLGAQAKKHLEAELADLRKADKLLDAKYKDSTGKARTQLFHEMTTVENRIRSVRGLIAKSVKDDRAAELQFALDQAKEAVEAAKQGTKAYDEAIAAEEKALKNEIAYWDKRAKNRKFSMDARDKALKQELKFQRQLKDLLAPELKSVGENEAQFLSSIKAIYASFGPNAWPTPAAGGKTDTHLYDIKNELRQQTPLLKGALRGGMFPATDHALITAGAVAG